MRGSTACCPYTAGDFLTALTDSSRREVQREAPQPYTAISSLTDCLCLFRHGIEHVQTSWLGTPLTLPGPVQTCSLGN